jgi:hypothetical protein
MKIKMKLSTILFATSLLIAFLLIPLPKSFANIKSTSPQLSSETQAVRDNQQDTFFNFDITSLSGKFYARLAINIISILILIRLIHYPSYRNIELYFTFFIFNFIIFLLAYLLNTVEMGIGAAFGLFAVFSMLRYRTENISAKDMTYLFIAIAIGLITAISKSSAIELTILNGLILFVTFIVEGNIFLKKEFSKSVQYENIEMINQENHDALIHDLRKRTGLNIHRITIGKVDFLKDSAIIKFYYYEDKNNRQNNAIHT